MTVRRAKLIVLKGSLAKRTISLGASKITIGRDAGNTIVISDEAVSRYHAEIKCAHMQYFVTDLSRNGTWINQTRLEPDSPYSLKHQDRIQIAGGVAILEFQDPSATVTVGINTRTRLGMLIDPDKREIWIDGQQLHPPLSPQQYSFLWMLYQRPGKTFGRDEIVPFVWTGAQVNAVSEEMIDALASRIRKRIREHSSDHEYIVTLRGHGFKFVQRY